MRPRLLLLALLAVAACATPDTPTDSASAPDVAPADTTARLTADGWGPLRIGMMRQEAAAALGDRADPDAVGGPEPEVCDEYAPNRGPEGMLVMVEDGAVTRVRLSRSGVQTPKGLGVGDPADAVRNAYGEAIDEEPHKYVAPPAAYLTVWRSGEGTPSARGIRYEIGTDGRVASVLAGGPSIEYVEGCL